MSNATPPSAPSDAQRPVEVVVISHTPFFYWWPVWLVGFIMAGLTWWYGDPIAFVPQGTEAVRGAHVEGIEGPRDVLIAPAGQTLPAASESDAVRQPRLRMAASNNLGIIWTLTLCLAVVITHVPLRGIYSVIVIVVICFLTGVLAFFGLWDPIFKAVQFIDIHITAAGYMTISVFLLVLWLLTFLLYDRMVFMVFSRGQLRVRKAIGLGETVFDTRGMVVQKHRDALFRHWLLGFGSGDLTINTSGPNPRQFDMPNVLFVDRKLTLINTMLQEREVFSAR